MLILYEFLLAIYVICYMPILFIKGKWHSGFLERFSFFSEAIKKRIDHPKNIWIHAVSVGEVIAIAELIRQLRAKYPDCQIVLSTSTKGQQPYPKIFQAPVDALFWSMSKERSDNFDILP